MNFTIVILLVMNFMASSLGFSQQCLKITLNEPLILAKPSNQTLIATYFLAPDSESPLLYSSNFPSPELLTPKKDLEARILFKVLMPHSELYHEAPLIIPAKTVIHVCNALDDDQFLKVPLYKNAAICYLWEAMDPDLDQAIRLSERQSLFFAMTLVILSTAKPHSEPDFNAAMIQQVFGPRAHVEPYISNAQHGALSNFKAQFYLRMRHACL